MGVERSPVTENGRMWAVLCYLSFLVGFPIGFVPLVTRDDEFALFHARHSTAVWLAVFVSTSVLAVFYVFASFVTCGLASVLVLPVFLLPAAWGMTTGIHGLVLALDNRWEEPLGTFGLGDRMFSNVELDPAKRRPSLPGTSGGPPPPPPDPEA